MSHLTLEVVEGPDAGRATPLAGTVEIGRDPSADLRLSDEQASRRHARVTVRSGHALVEDLGSSNGTFLNQSELHATAPVAAGDELLIGVTVIQVRSAAQVAAQPSAVRAVPPGLAVEPRRPTFVDAVADPPNARAIVPQLDRLVDSRVRAQARLAPFAIVVLVALVVVIYLGSQ